MKTNLFENVCMNFSDYDLNCYEKSENKIMIKKNHYILNESTCDFIDFSLRKLMTIKNKYRIILNLRNGDISVIQLNWFNYLLFLWIQRKCWIQQENNVRYVINILFLMLGLLLGFKSL